MHTKKILYTPEAVATRVTELGRRIKADYETLLRPGEQLLAIGVLNGAFIFMADLLRAAADLPIEVDFVRLSSYQDRTTSSSQVVMTKNLEKEVKGRHVLVVEDIADCGLTLDWLLQYLKGRGPTSIRVAVAVDKTYRRETVIPLNYVGFTLKSGFLVGYGLDYAEKFRNLPGIHQMETKKEQRP